MQDLRTYLKEGNILLFDGAMGTYYTAMTGRTEERCEQANLDDPRAITGIHRAYLTAGARALRTNTFALSADVARRRDGQAAKLIEAACRIAREAARPFDAYVFADMGPAPEVDDRTAAEIYIRQADMFLAQGMTLFSVETLPTDAGLAELARHLKERCPEAFLLVSFAIGTGGQTHEGELGEVLYRRAAACPQIDAVGFNCVSGPLHLFEYIQGLEREERVYLTVMPNAGYPTVLGRRVLYQGAPDYFGRTLAKIAGAGARIVGGCCGTTPEHLSAAAAALREPLPVIPLRKREPRRESAPPPDRFGEKLERGERVIAVELDPPADDDLTFFLEGVKTLRAAGADIITIADCPVGRPRADSSLLACKVRRELSIEPLPHMTCRDRNLNATKALLLGLSMEGVRNVLLVTGDPIPTENREEVKTVFNFNSRKLLRYISGLNETLFRAPFRMFAALNLNSQNFDVQLKMALEKEENGAAGFLTQPVLSPEALENLKLARRTLKGKILGGIYPIVSYRNACFLNNEIAGMHVSDEIIAMYKGRDREEAEEIAVRLCARIAGEVEPWTDGLYLMTPFRRVELMTRILKKVRREIR